MHRIYLDYNASTPIAPEVAEVMLRTTGEAFGNPSSLHWAGVSARQILDKARGQVADLLACAPDEIVFTSGGSEANNLALKGAFYASNRARRHFITTSVEHPAIVTPLRFLEKLGAEVTWLPVDHTGRIDPDDLRRAIRADTLLISIMHANNEVGTIQPIKFDARFLSPHHLGQRWSPASLFPGHSRHYISEFAEIGPLYLLSTIRLFGSCAVLRTQFDRDPT